jgi:hypothetical protein
MQWFWEKHLCRGDDNNGRANIANTDVTIDQEIATLEEQTVHAVEKLNCLTSYED